MPTLRPISNIKSGDVIYNNLPTRQWCYEVVSIKRRWWYYYCHLRFIGDETKFIDIRFRKGDLVEIEFNSLIVNK